LSAPTSRARALSLHGRGKGPAGLAKAVARGRADADAGVVHGANRDRPRVATQGSRADGRARRTDKNYDKFRRYDAFLAWWWRQTELGERGEAPFVLFICQNEAQRDDFLARADGELTGHRWHPSSSAEQHEYIGRRRMLFCDERDAHLGRPQARRLPPYPPEHPARNGRDAECRGVRLPGGAPNRAPVAAPFPDGNARAKPVPAHTEAKATRGSSIRASVPGNSDDLGQKEADSEVRRPRPAVLEDMPVPAKSRFARADTVI
jgi:hypothetical protein